MILIRPQPSDLPMRATRKEGFKDWRHLQGMCMMCKYYALSAYIAHMDTHLIYTMKYLNIYGMRDWNIYMYKSFFNRNIQIDIYIYIYHSMYRSKLAFSVNHWFPAGGSPVDHLAEAVLPILFILAFRRRRHIANHHQWNAMVLPSGYVKIAIENDHL